MPRKTQQYAITAKQAAMWRASHIRLTFQNRGIRELMHFLAEGVKSFSKNDFCATVATGVYAAGRTTGVVETQFLTPSLPKASPLDS